MALLPPAVYAILLANRDTGISGFDGAAYTQLCLGVADGVCAWAVGQPDNIALSGTATGLAGVGAVIPLGSALLVPVDVPLMADALAGAGLLGPLATSLAISMACGISEAFSTLAWYTGVSGGVGDGADISKVIVANPATLITTLTTTLAGAGMTGPAIQQMAVGLGNGIAAMLFQGTGAAPVTGVTSVPPAPSSGVTTSVLV